MAVQKSGGKRLTCGYDLRENESDVDTGMVSLYHTRYSSAGEGNVALITIGGDGGFSGVCTDNRPLAR